MVWDVTDFEPNMSKTREIFGLPKVDLYEVSMNENSQGWTVVPWQRIWGFLWRTSIGWLLCLGETNGFFWVEDGWRLRTCGVILGEYMIVLYSFVVKAKGFRGWQASQMLETEGPGITAGGGQRSMWFIENVSAIWVCLEICFPKIIQTPKCVVILFPFNKLPDLGG